MQWIAQNVSKYEIRPYATLGNSDIETGVFLKVRLVTSHVKKNGGKIGDLCNFDAALTIFIHLVYVP